MLLFREREAGELLILEGTQGGPESAGRGSETRCFIACPEPLERPPGRGLRWQQAQGRQEGHSSAPPGAPPALLLPPPGVAGTPDPLPTPGDQGTETVLLFSFSGKESGGAWGTMCDAVDRTRVSLMKASALPLSHSVPSL